MQYDSLAASEQNIRYAQANASSKQEFGPLERLDTLANQADRIAEMIQQFLARWYGGGPADEACANALCSSGHSANLDRLVKNMDQLEKLTTQLSSIG